MAPHLAARFEDVPLLAVMDHQIRNRFACRPLRRAPAISSLLGGSGEASVTKRAGRHHLHHPRRQRRARLSVADPAGALDGRLGLRRSCHVWTWVLLLGSMMDFGISASAQKIIPEYRTRGRARAAARLSVQAAAG